MAEGKLRCDAAAFEQALDRGELEEAVGLYSGPLLDGFHVRGADEFERWPRVPRKPAASCVP